MNQWIALGVFILGTACGALLTRIHLVGLKSRSAETRD